MENSFVRGLVKGLSYKYIYMFGLDFIDSKVWCNCIQFANVVTATNQCLCVLCIIKINDDAGCMGIYLLTDLCFILEEFVITERIKENTVQYYTIL